MECVSVYTLRCRQTGESGDVYVCAEHAKEMPPTDGDLVTARAADAGIACEFCPASRRCSHCHKPNPEPAHGDNCPALD